MIGSRPQGFSHNRHEPKSTTEDFERYKTQRETQYTMYLGMTKDNPPLTQTEFTRLYSPNATEFGLRLEGTHD